MSAYFVQALIISTLNKAVRLTAVWGGYYCCFHFTDDEAEAHQQGVCVTGPGNHPTQCSDSGSWARVFNCIFYLVPSIIEGPLQCHENFCPRIWDFKIWMGSFTLTPSLNSISVICVDFGLKDSGLNAEDGVGQAFVTQMGKGSVCTTVPTPHLHTRARPHENKAVNLTALGNWDHWMQSRIW